MNPINIARIGQGLAVVGSIITSIACFYNSVLLDPLLALKIWRISNILLFCWAVGYWRKWWVDGVAARFLVGMYFVFIVTNEIGIWRYGGDIW